MFLHTSKSEPLSFQRMPVDSYPTTVHHWFPLLNYSHISSEGQLTVPSEAIFSPRGTSPGPSVSHHMAGAPITNHLAGPLLNSIQFIDVSPVLRLPKLAISRQALVRAEGDD